MSKDVKNVLKLIQIRPVFGFHAKLSPRFRRSNFGK